MASMVRFKYPANGDRPPVDLCWYDGGMRPATPVELMNDNKGLPEEGMMFIGDKGKILAGFNVQDPQIISGKKWRNQMQRLMREARWNRPHRHCPCLLMHAGAVNNTRQFFGSRILNRGGELICRSIAHKQDAEV